MARAAVKAKQQAAAKAQPAKTRSRGRRGHSGGGNPNQELFFVRLRRHQKWVYLVLAAVFMISFVFVGVGSGNGGGLQSLYNGIFGGSGGSSISKAQAEIKTNPAKGYSDLATAYEQAGQPASAMIALQQYLQVRPKDAGRWGELGGLELTSGGNYATKYQAAQQAAQAADPSALFLPGGTLGTAVGQNPAYATASQQAAARTSALYQKAVGAYSSAVTDFQKASKLQPKSSAYLPQLATAAQNAGNNKVAAAALTRYLKLNPNAPQKKQIKAQIKALSGSQTPTVSGG